MAALVMERVAFRPVRGANPSTLLVTSFALSFLLQNLAIVATDGLPKGIELLPQLTTAYHFLGLRFRQIDLAAVITTAVLLLGLTTFLNRTAMGIQMRAAAEDFRMARLLGVNANKVIATAFALSGLLAGVAAILLIAQSGTVSPTIGLGPVLVAFTATIMGGLGNLRGAMLGGFTLACITVGLQAGLPSDLQSFREAFVFAFVIAVLLLRPQGLVVAAGRVERV
jgi:branched-chain amino acid transport system permease protein